MALSQCGEKRAAGSSAVPLCSGEESDTGEVDVEEL